MRNRIACTREHVASVVESALQKHRAAYVGDDFLASKIADELLKEFDIEWITLGERLPSRGRK